MTYEVFKYQVCGLEDGVFETTDVEQFIVYLQVRGFECTGNSGFKPHVHEWLNEQPEFDGLCGPMGNGIKDGVPCVRYETWELYNRMSI